MCFFLKKSEWDIVIASVRPSVCPLCFLLLNHQTKFNQIWCVSYSHEWGVQHEISFGPAPWDPGEGPKGQIAFNFNYKVNFKDFIPNFVCFSQIKDTKHIRQDLHYIAWVMPQGRDFGALGVLRGSNNISNMIMWHIKSTGMTSRTECK